MIELKEKTVEELRKMASKKKIEGRSKMNKAQLVRALQKKSSSKKIIRKKMKGGNPCIIESHGIRYNCDKLNFIRTLLTPSTNNTPRPKLYIIGAALNMPSIRNREELLQHQHYLVTNIDNVPHIIDQTGRIYFLNRAEHNPPRTDREGHIILFPIQDSFSVDKDIFLIQDDNGDYRIFRAKNERTISYTSVSGLLLHAAYEQKLRDLGLGDEERLFSIIPPQQPGQA